MKPITKAALIHAVATAAYVALVGSFLFYGGKSGFGRSDTALIPVALLMLLVLSVAMVGVLLFGRPVLWCLDGRRKDVLALLVRTLVFFFALTVIAFAVLFSYSALNQEQFATRTVQLYYYSAEQDTDTSGNIACSRNGVVPVERDIPRTDTPIQDTIHLLLAGELSAEERARGISTEYPLEGFSLTGVSLKDGVLTLSFDDPNNKTVGGACRVGILWFQIEETTKQFAGVQQVRFLPEELFQP